MAKVMIDPGHAPGNTNSGKNGYYEYAGMWRLSNYLKAALERCGVTAALTRTENADPSLAARGKAAAGYDLFISQHSNAANGAARGVEVYYSVRIPGDRDFAAEMARDTAALMGSVNRGAKTREADAKGWDYYTVMLEAQKAGAKHVLLAETGFHDNASDEAFLLVDVNLAKIAEAQAKVICKYLGVAYKALEGGASIGNPTDPTKPAIGALENIMKVSVNGGAVRQIQSVLYKDYNYPNLRELCAMLGIPVDYDAATNTALLTKK